MSFTAQCPFCRIVLQGVPDERAGLSNPCPRCHNQFTLAAMSSRHKWRLGRVRAAAPSPPSPDITPPPATRSPRPPAPDASPPQGESDDTAPSARPAPWQYLGLAAFLAGTFALPSAFLSGSGPVVFTLAAGGVVLGALGIAVHAARRAGIKLPAAGLAVSVPVLLLATFWPDILGLAPRNAAAVDETGDAGEAVVPDGRRPGAAQRPLGATEWVDASTNVLQQAGARVRVVAAEVKPGASSGEKPLFLRLRITNVRAGVMDYAGWFSPGGPGPWLRDNSGKSYRRQVVAGPARPAGAPRPLAVPPWKFVEEVLAFEAPSRAVTFLRLELPAAAVGAEGTFRLELPRRMIVFR